MTKLQMAVEYLKEQGIEDFAISMMDDKYVLSLARELEGEQLNDLTT